MSILLRILLVLLSCLPMLVCAEPSIVLEGSNAVFGSTDIAVGISFPPFSNSSQMSFTVSELKKMSIGRMRIAIDWRDREPKQGKFYWGPMDLRMQTAKDNGISVFLTILSLAPDWALLPAGSDGACIMDEQALKSFIEALVLRYDNIDKIQFGNEWETEHEEGTGYADTESLKKFVIYNNILFDAVQNHSPNTKVVLGGLTSTYPLVEFFTGKGSCPDFSGLRLARGVTIDKLNSKLARSKLEYDSKGIRQNIDYVFEHAQYDMLDIHLYDDAENWPSYVSVLPKDKPILVSEFGGPNSEFENTSSSYQAQRMNHYIDAIEKLPIVEAYYFKLVDSPTSYHKDSGLFFSSLRAKPARTVFMRRLSVQLPELR